MDNHRVVVTGLGPVTPLGIGRDAFWTNLLRGQIAVNTITRFDASIFPSHVAAQIDDFDPAAFLSKRRLQWTDRFSQMAVAGARLALEDARLAIDDGSEVGVYTGSALGGLTLAEESIQEYHKLGIRAVRPLLAISVFGGAAACNIAIDFDLTGPSIANANSCASGAVAIGEAFRAIRRGDIRAAIAGGVEAPLAPLTFGAFTVARAMSTRNHDPHGASRPFDRERDGFVMAEGAGIVVLERLDDAITRGATPYCEIVGYGLTNDANHMSAPLSGGEQTAAAMRAALREAATQPDEVDAVNAHGSSTRIGDAAEVRAYHRIFGERTSSIPITATKGQHGHALGATGAWEIAATALTFRDGLLPGAVNLNALDDDVALNCERTPIELKPSTVLSNSSGFGGINTALVLKKI